MTIRFAAARSRHNRMLGRVFDAGRRRLPANDNAFATAADPAADHLLGEALRHFARHGLRAAHQAREQAEAAHAAGERESYDWWLSICRMLDRRMAAALESRSAGS